MLLVYLQEQKHNVGKGSKDYFAVRYNTNLGKEFLKLKFASARSFEKNLKESFCVVPGLEEKNLEEITIGVNSRI